MYEWFRHLERLSKEQKSMYAFLGATLFTSICALFWVVSLPSKLEQISPSDVDSTSFSEVRTFLDDAKNGMNTIGEVVPELVSPGAQDILSASSTAVDDQVIVTPNSGGAVIQIATTSRRAE